MFGFKRINSSIDGISYELIDARKAPNGYKKLFTEYYNELLAEDDSLLNYSVMDLILEDFNDPNSHPYVIKIRNTLVGLVVFSNEPNVASDNDAHSYINELFIKKEYRRLGIASDISLKYLNSLKHDTGLCYIVGSESSKFWFNLLDNSKYTYTVYKEDELRNFIHINIGK